MSHRWPERRVRSGQTTRPDLRAHSPLPWGSTLDHQRAEEPTMGLLMRQSPASPTRGDRPRRLSALIGVGVITVLTLTGCIKVDATVAIAPDATASGTFAFELQKEAASFLGINTLDDFSSQIDQGALTDGEELDAFQECVSSETETGFAYTCTFANTPFSDADGLWSISKEDATIVFTMVNDGGGEANGEAAGLLGDAGMGSIDVDVEFPGPITSVEGDFVEQVSENEARVSASMTDSVNVTIRSEDGESSAPIAVILIIAGTAGIVVLLIVAVVLLAMRRRAGASGSGTSDSEASDFGAAEVEPASSPAADATPAVESSTENAVPELESGESDQESSDDPS